MNRPTFLGGGAGDKNQTLHLSKLVRKLKIGGIKLHHDAAIFRKPHKQQLYSGKFSNSHEKRETRCEKKKFLKKTSQLSEFPNIIPALTTC